MMRSTQPRRGAALIAAMAILAVLGVLLGTTAMHFVRARALLVHRANVLQARWLARAGIDVAIDRLRDGDFEKATLEPIADARVVVTATKDPKIADRFVIRAEAHYPTDGITVVKTVVEKVLTRTGGTMEVTSPTP